MRRSDQSIHQCFEPGDFMKYLIHLAFVSMLLAGCADTPLKQASIEDRASTATSGKSDANAAAGKSSAGSSAASTTGASISDISAKPLAGTEGKTQAGSGVETRGVVIQNPEAKSLNGATSGVAGDKVAGAASANGAGAQPDGADKLKFVAQPVLDPKNPQSPLAQRRLLFDYDSAAIRDEYRTLLEMHAQYLKNEKVAKLILQGHADERGSREYNLALGQRRAESVYKAMNLLGVQDAQMEAVSLGEEKPVAEGHDESAWMQNRRTELLYQGE
jgi:peptidoglycan-associated lipoprotein